MKIVFVHGWGFSPNIWHKIQKKLPSHECIFVDLGYFNNTPTEFNSLPKDALYIGHSLGLLWILKYAPEKASALISIAGFDCFYQHIPIDILPKMKVGLIKNTEHQLITFYKQCGLSNFTPLSSFQITPLMAGLDMLASLDLKTQIESLTIPISILASKNDFIVSRRMTKKIWSNFDINWSNDGGHILPITKSEWCTSHILNLINRL